MKIPSKPLPIESSRSLDAVILVTLLVAVFVDFTWILLVASYLAVILIHEIGHACMAARYGVAGHSIELHVLHGRFWYETTANEFEDAMIAWGGVVAQAVVFVPSIIFFQLLGHRLPGAVNLMLLVLGYFNLMVAIMNLAPVRGLDGDKCWRVVGIRLREAHAVHKGPAPKKKPAQWCHSGLGERKLTSTSTDQTPLQGP